MSIATIAAVATVAGTSYSIYSSNKASKEAKRAREEQLRLAGSAQGDLQGLLAEQQDPVAVFKDIFTSFPGLLDQVLPSFRRQSIDSAKEFTGANVDLYKKTLSDMFPNYAALRARREGIINEMDPANLGQEEIKGVTRKLSPLIPEGTLDPSRGSVAGGTTSPVSLYRNLVSGLYQERRGQFLQASTNLQMEDQNSVARQQVKSEQFLPLFLSAASNAAAGLTTAVGQQEQSNIATQVGLMNSLMGGIGPDNSNAYAQQQGAAVKDGINGLAAAYSLYKNGQSNTYKAPAATTSYSSTQPMHSLADRPGATQYYTGANAI